MVTDPRSLDETIGNLTSALGDPTRRGIYITIRESASALTAAGIAELFSIHSNVARHHLDRLVDDGYLRSVPGDSTAGAGRPAKGYQSTEKTIDLHFPSERRDLLNELLLRLVGAMQRSDIADLARDVGRQYGLELAAEIGGFDDAGYESTVRAVATAMTGVGFGITPSADGSELLTSHCPFGENAMAHPEVICSLDQGLVDGLMEAIDPACTTVVLPHAQQHDPCVTSVEVSIANSG